MSRITKEIAKQVAEKLTEKKNEDLQKLKEKSQKIVTEMYLDTIPKSVLDFFKSHKNYVNTTGFVRLQGNGFVGYNSWTLSETCPKKEYEPWFSPDKNQAKILIDIENRIKYSTKEYSSLNDEIEIALIGLRTFKNVEREFPEAIPFLPKTQINTQLAVDLSQIRSRIAK